MHRIVIASALVLLGSSGLFAQPPGQPGVTRPPKKYALLIGLDTYRRAGSIPQLKFAEDDARDLASLLSSQQFEKPIVLLGSDVTRSNIIAELYKFAHIAQ